MPDSVAFPVLFGRGNRIGIIRPSQSRRPALAGASAATPPAFPAAAEATPPARVASSADTPPGRVAPARLRRAKTPPKSRAEGTKPLALSPLQAPLAALSGRPASRVGQANRRSIVHPRAAPPPSVVDKHKTRHPAKIGR
jgi:hypothetical protein